MSHSSKHNKEGRDSKVFAGVGATNSCYLVPRSTGGPWGAAPTTLQPVYPAQGWCRYARWHLGGRDKKPAPNKK